METNLSSFQPRTDFIISLLPNLVAQNRRIIILTSRRDQIADFIEKISLLSIGNSWSICRWYETRFIIRK